MDARVKWQRIKDNPQHNAICFEPLEPRLLLSGTWGAGADSPVSESSGVEQATVATTTEAETDQTGATDGAIDLLGTVPTMHLIDSDNADTDAAAISESTAAQAETSESSNAPDSSDAAPLDDSPSQLSDTQSVRELIIVNDNVADYEQLVADLQAGKDGRIIDVAVTDADGDGIQQVSEILSQYSDLSAVHFITHGADNRINIGGTWLNESSLPQYENAVSNWGDALNVDGDLLFYGCNVASGGAGQNLLDHIADLTGADVAASDDPTGSTQLDGDWDLEFNSGAIETQVVVDAGAQAGWEHLMVAPDDLQATTTTNGGLQLNHDGGNDAYLIADDGGTLLGGLSQMTFEMRFSTTHTMTDNVLASYATLTYDNEFAIFIKPTGDLEVIIGNSITSNAIDYQAALEDGNPHSLAVTWDASTGGWEIFVDGGSVDSGTGLKTSAIDAASGTLVFGQDQDSVDGGYDPTQRFTGTLFDARFFNTVRSSGDIATNYQSILPYDESNMIANWTFDNYSTGGVVTDKVSGNNLTEQHAGGGGFTTSTPELTLSVDENAANSTVVGTVIGNDAERQAQIATLLGADPDLSYSSITNKFYKTVTSAVTWTTAESNAQSTTLSGVSGQLVTIHSAAENEIVYNLVQLLGGHTHIGASDATTEGEWRWQSGGADADQFWQGDETGNAVNGSYQHWNTGQPNDLGGSEDYAGMDVSNGRWYDLNGSLNNYIVEWDADDVLDATDELTYSIQSQTVSGAFTIDSDSGEITVADGSLLDYETNPTHTLTVRVTDVNETLTYDEVFTISLNNVNEDPVITSSAAVNMEENQTAATTVTATDVDGDTPTFSITGGVDAGFFSINSTTGDLTFDSAPDYENPLDANTDNVYIVEVTADDGNGGTDIQTISVTVTDAAPAVPTVSGPGPIQTIDEDNPLVLSTGGGNAISISTSDADDIVEVTLDFPGGANGTLTLNGTAGLTFSIGTGTGDTSMRFHGTVADINAALDGLRFDPDPNWNSGGLSFGLEVNAANKTLCYSDPALLAHYTFDDAALGNDSSPNGYDGTINGATVQVDSERGEVLYLDGNANMEVSGRFGDPTTDLTLTAWVNVGTLDTNGAEIISLGDSVGMRVVDDAGSNKLQIFWYDGTTDQVLTNASVMGSGWHFVALTMHQTDPSFVEGEIYMDGSYGTFSVWPGPITYGGAKGANSFVGTHGNGAAGYDFEGSIDEVCVFDRVLDYSEISAFRQSTSRLVNIAVNAVNDAPVLTPASPTLTTITEDDTGNAGQTVASFVGASISDADSGAVEGIAITGLSSGNGSWEYSTNGGTSWNAVGAVADSSALLLRSSDLVRFVPDGQNGTSGSLTYRAWDQTSGSAGNKVDVSTNGGTTAFSTATDTAGITVTAANDRPVLTGVANLTNINEDDVSNSGTLVSSLFSSSDVDSGAVNGLAVWSVDNTNGSWEFSTDGGSSWSAFGSPNENNVRLLAADALTYVRFVPNANFNGLVSGLDYRIWDQTIGTAGGTIDMFANWGSLAFSLGSGSSSVTVIPVNDDPGFTGLDATPSFTEGGAAIVLDNNATVFDVELDALNGGNGNYNGAALTLARNGGANAEDLFDIPSGGSLTVAGGNISAAGNVIATFTNAGGQLQITFANNGTAPTTALVSEVLQAITYENTSDTPPASVQVDYSLDDGSTGTGTGSITVSITAINDAPVLTGDLTATVDESGEYYLTSADLGYTDPDDVDAGVTFTVSNITNGNGIYVDGVGLTTNFTGADLTAGIVRFVHDGSETTTASFDVNVEDGDEDGSMPTDSTFNFTVNPVNDNPSITASFDLASINEDDVSNSGTLVSSLISTSDPDIGAVSGMAVWSVNNTNGSWEFSTDGGSNWNAFGSPWTNNVRLLAADADTYVRFVPNANFNGAVSPGLRFMAWDQTIGTAGGTIDMTANFSSNAFSFGAGSSSITVNPVNDAPQATNLNAAETYTEDTPLDLTDIVVTDVDSANVTVTLTLSDVAAGSLSTGTSGAVTSTFAGSVWTASGAIADVNTLLAGVTFTPASNYNSNFSIATSVDDGVAAPVTGSKAMTGTAVNDAPQATNLNAAETYTEDTSLDLTDIVVTDVDSANVTVTLTLSDVAAGSLSTGTSNAVTSTFAGGVWTASGAIADVNTLLAGVTFTPASNYNSNFTIATSVDDGTAPAVIGSKAMTGTAVNDLPQVTNLAAPETYTEDISLNLTDIVVSDVDNTDVTVTLTLSDTSAGSLNTGTSGAVTSTFDGQVWTASGAIADVNALLAGVTFTPAANYDSNFAIAVNVDDDVDAGIISGVKLISATPVNDDFTDNNESISVDENSGANTGNVIDGTSVDGPITVTQFLINGDATVYGAGATATIAGVGSLTLNANGDYSFTPNVDYNGTVPQVTYTLTDGSGTDDTSTLDITVDNTSGDDSPETGGGGTGSDKDDDNGSENDDDNDSEKDDDSDSEKDGDTDPELPRPSIPPDLRPGPPPRTPLIDPDDSLDGIDSIIPDDEGSSSEMAAVFNDLMRGQAKPETIRGTPSLGSFFSSEALIQSLESIGQQLDLNALASKAAQGNFIVGVTTGLTVSVFAGYVIWAFRGASLLVGAVSAMPMWRCFDPLPVLLGGGKKRSEEEEEEMTPEVEDAEDNVNELLGLEQMDSSRQVVIPEESSLV